jgi:hypothetical protein
VVGAAGALNVVATADSGRRETVYNFEVEEFHTYFVGSGAAWVHNDCKDKDKKKKDEEKGKKDKKAGEKCKGNGDCARGHCRTLRNGEQKCVDCTPDEADNFVGIKDRFCKSEPVSCLGLALDGSAPLSDFDTRIANGNRCVDARVAERDRCFGGGDLGHDHAIDLAGTARSLCGCLKEIAALPGLSARAIQNGKKQCNERFKKPPLPPGATVAD